MGLRVSDTDSPGRRAQLVAERSLCFPFAPGRSAPRVFSATIQGRAGPGSARVEGCCRVLSKGGTETPEGAQVRIAVL